LKTFASGIAFLLASLTSSGQEMRTIRFEPFWGSSPIQLDSTYVLHDIDSVKVSTLRFYISSLILRNEGMKVWAEDASYHLFDVSVPTSMEVSVPVALSANEIVLLLGTDSLTNVSGAMGGDLDPSKGMYWAWNSGYINFKLEGTSTACKTIDQEFQFHLGGYAYPNATAQEIRLPISNSNLVKMDLAAFFQEIDLKSLDHIMSPSANAVQLSRIAAGIFTVQP
jgi:hypothetical protein